MPIPVSFSYQLRTIVLGIEQIDRHLDEHGAGHALHRELTRALDGRHERGHGLDHRRPLHHRLHDRQLIDVLQRAAALEQGRRRATEQDHRRLRHLRVLERRHRIGHARPRGHRGDADRPGHARDRIGGEHRVGLVADVDDAQPSGLRAREDRRDVPAAQREEVGRAVARQDVCDEVTTVSHGRQSRAPC